MLSSLLVTLLSYVTNLEKLEQPIRDLRYRTRFQKDRSANGQQTSSPEIVLVVTDSKSLDQIELPHGFWSGLRAEALKLVIEQQPLAVGCDSLWQLDPDGLKKFGSEFGATKEYLSRAETQFALLAADERVVVGGHWDGQKVQLPRESIAAMAGKRIGLLNQQEDDDGTIRKGRAQYALSGQVWSSLPGAMADICGRVTPPPNGLQEPFWINYQGPSGSFPRISLVDLLEGRNQVPLKGKVVLFGTYDPRLLDRFRSPFSEDGTPDMYGVEVHANALNTLLQGQYLHECDRFLAGASSLAVALLVALCVAEGSAVTMAVGLPGLLLGWTGLSFVLFQHRGLWLPVADKALVVCANGVLCLFLKEIFVERSRRQLTKIFSRFAPPQLVDQVLKNPELARLGGVSYDVTLLFTDINGFSTLSEKVTPQELIEMVNRYFREMTTIIHRHQGLIRQFVGDEIMVIFGAPVPTSNHAQTALLCVVEMQQRLAQMAKETPNTLGFYSVKAGIHSGHVVCGNVGGEERMEYTAVGDDVNLASRVMGLNKTCKTDILITKESLAQISSLPKNVTIQPLGAFPVKGREHQVELSEVRLNDNST